MSPHDEKELSRFEKKESLTKEQAILIETYRGYFKDMAAGILTYVPSSADRSSAIRYLRLAHMQVNAAICHDWPEKENDN